MIFIMFMNVLGILLRRTHCVELFNTIPIYRYNVFHILITHNELVLLYSNICTDGTMVNITDKKRLKYYKARLNNGSRPLRLTFFRPDEGEEEEPNDSDEDVTGLYITKYEPPENPTPPPAQASPVKEKTGKHDTLSKDERSARRVSIDEFYFLFMIDILRSILLREQTFSLL